MELIKNKAVFKYVSQRAICGYSISNSDRWERHIVSSAPHITRSWLHGAGKMKRGQVFLQGWLFLTGWLFSLRQVFLSGQVFSSGRPTRAICLSPFDPATGAATLSLPRSGYDIAAMRRDRQPRPLGKRDDPPALAWPASDKHHPRKVAFRFSRKMMQKQETKQVFRWLANAKPLRATRRWRNPASIALHIDLRLAACPIRPGDKWPITAPQARLRKDGRLRPATATDGV